MATVTDRMVARVLAEGHPGDAARVLERFDEASAADILAEWAPRPAARVLEQMMPELAAAGLSRLPPATAREVLAELHLDSVVGLLRRAPEEAREAVMAGMSEGRREPLRRLLAHPEGTAGGLMDPMVLALPDDVDAEAAMQRVRQSPQHALAYLYVVDRAGRLVGVTSLRDLMTAAPRAHLGTLTRTPVMRLHAGDDRRAILVHPGWNEFHALPVVDAEGRFLGAVRYETLRRLEIEGAAQPAERAVSVAVSLGELYWMGLSGLVEGLGAVALRGAGGRRPDER
jgi:magnesium transporter